MTEQHEQGRKAHAEGKARHENPHDINTENWSRWMDGYDQAATEAMCRKDTA
ncbi:hypothetical protein [Aureimonas sp. AU22]|uniref:hypothetical protein n=1 Tax=Aureimonas sp. AU22 TaxID=1638162 RepID=UPI000B2C194C|nr:hypothetical protein [Aureimonas sp. AU22]